MIERPALAARVERADAAADESHASGLYGDGWHRRTFRASSLSSALGELRGVIRAAKVESGLHTIAEAFGPPSAPGVWIFFNDGTPDRDEAAPSTALADLSRAQPTI